MYFSILLISLAFYFGSKFIVPQIIKYSVAFNLLDAPDHRKNHVAPTPALGGIAIFLGLIGSVWISTGWLQLAMTPWVLLIAVASLFVVGLVDDIRYVSAYIRLLLQAGLGLLVVYSGLVIPIESVLPFAFSGILNGCSTVFFIVFLINAYNFIDGIDGLLGSVSTVGLLFFSLLFCAVGAYAWAFICLGTGAAVAGFLRYNFYQAKIFMGDNGSTVLGFLLAYLSIVFINLPESNLLSINTWMLGLMVHVIPAIDLLRVSIIRIAKGNSPLLADRTHIHHLLLNQLGDTRLVVLTIVFGECLMLLNAFATGWVAFFIMPIVLLIYIGLLSGDVSPIVVRVLTTQKFGQRLFNNI